jgi:hypothetical protein
VWAFNFFFYNKKMKRILYIGVKALSKTAAEEEKVCVCGGGGGRHAAVLCLCTGGDYSKIGTGGGQETCSCVVLGYMWRLQQRRKRGGGLAGVVKSSGQSQCVGQVVSCSLVRDSHCSIKQCWA